MFDFWTWYHTLYVSLLVVFVLDPRIFLQVLVFSSLDKNQVTFLTPSVTGNLRATGLTVISLICAILVDKVDKIILLTILYKGTLFMERLN